MDAVKFLREKERMCNNYLGCDSCPVAVTLGRACKYTLDENYEEFVKIVENWSNENPKELDKKYIIEIGEVECNGLAFKIKGTGCWLNREQLEQLEEYKESEE